jgi:hypothetical protein
MLELKLLRKNLKNLLLVGKPKAQKGPASMHRTPPPHSPSQAPVNFSTPQSPPFTTNPNRPLSRRAAPPRATVLLAGGSYPLRGRGGVAAMASSAKVTITLGRSGQVSRRPGSPRSNIRRPDCAAPFLVLDSIVVRLI